jgi:RNA polymerase sigma factor (sigma-70 family)
MTWMDVIEASDCRIIKDREEEYALFRAARAGDESAKLVLLRSQWPLVYKMASRFNDKDEAISVGMVGLLMAYNKFDPARGNRFVTVAHMWIYQQLMDWHNKNLHILYAPRNLIESARARKRRGLDDDFMPSVMPIEACQVFNNHEQAACDDMPVREIEGPPELAERNERVQGVRNFVRNLRPLDRGFMENYLRGVGIKKCGDCAANYNTVIKRRVFAKIKEDLKCFA